MCSVYRYFSISIITCPRTSPIKVLTINVDNVNEPPEFDNIAYYCILEESDVSLCI